MKRDASRGVLNTRSPALPQGGTPNSSYNHHSFTFWFSFIRLFVLLGPWEWRKRTTVRTFAGGIGLFTAFLCMPLNLVCSIWYFSCLLKQKRMERAHVTVRGSVSRIRPKQNFSIGTVSVLSLESLAELTSRNPLCFTPQRGTWSTWHHGTC